VAQGVSPSRPQVKRIIKGPPVGGSLSVSDCLGIPPKSVKSTRSVRGGNVVQKLRRYQLTTPQFSTPKVAVCHLLAAVAVFTAA
jgi:hypothetical protein